MSQIDLEWLLGVRSEYQSHKRLKKKPNVIYLISAKCITNFLLILKKERWEKAVPPPLGAQWTSSRKFITSRCPTCFPDTSVGFNSISVMLAEQPWAWRTGWVSGRKKREAAALGWDASGAWLRVYVETMAGWSGSWLRGTWAYY